jgi:hypothetical protein
VHHTNAPDSAVELFQSWKVLQLRANAIHCVQLQVLQQQASQVLAQVKLSVAPQKMQAKE